MENLSNDLSIVEKTDELFTHEEIVYLGEKLIDFELVGMTYEGEKLVKVYKRSN